MPCIRPPGRQIPLSALVQWLHKSAFDSHIQSTSKKILRGRLYTGTQKVAQFYRPACDNTHVTAIARLALRIISARLNGSAFTIVIPAASCCVRIEH
jgi:hypothetical protein